MTPIKTAGLLAVIAGAGLAPAAAQSAPRGTSCANPWQVHYSRGKIVGDTAKVAVQVASKGRTITIAWRAQRGNHFCAITVLEARGQIFRSVNPQASYTYTDYTTNHSNRVKTLTATARTSP